MLRDYQEKNKREIYQAIRSGHKKIVLAAATSYGKTALSASIVKDVLEKKRKVMFCAPLITLVHQTADEYEKFGIKDYGIIQGDLWRDYSQPVQIVSTQSLDAMIKRDEQACERFVKDKVIIIDELHIFYSTYEWLLDKCEIVIGLSATPWRRGLGNHFSKLITGPSVRWLIDNGHLSDYEAYSHEAPSMKGVSIVNGDFSLSESGERYTPKLIGDIVRTWERQAKGLQTILFAPRIVDCERFAREFRDNGYSAKAVSGYMDSDEAFREVEKFKQHETTILCSVSKLATGFSVTDVGCLIDAQPTKSLMRFYQKIGRGLRKHPGKDKLIILDHSGNLIRNGLPDDATPQKLSKKEEKEQLDRKKDHNKPKKCPKCNFVKPPKTPICPSCGFKVEKRSELEVESGELVKLKKKVSYADIENFYGGLVHFEVKRGYRKGWADFELRDKFGDNVHQYLDRSKVRAMGGMAPAQDVIGWIKHKQIRRAKRKYK